MSRKKVIVLVSLALLVILVIAVPLFLLRNGYFYKIGADVNIANISSNQKNSHQIIKINYSKADILKAFKTTPSDALFSKIMTDIKNQLDAKQKNQPQVSAKAADNKNIVKDQVVILADSQGKVVSEPVDNSVKLNSVQDNFSFDQRLTEQQKTYLIKGYDKITAIYGQRENNNIIKVRVDETCFNSMALPTINTIVLCTDYGNMIIDENTLIHELTHVFHGNHIVSSLWEEGSAMIVTSLVRYQAVGSDSSLINVFDVANIPADDYWDAQNANDGFSAYVWGGTALHKLYIQDHNFFKKFNRLLYTRPITSSRFTNQELIELAVQVEPIIEGAPAGEWFGKFYAFTPTDKFHTPSTAVGDSGIKPIIADNFRLGVTPGPKGSPNDKVKIELFTSQGNLLAVYKNNTLPISQAGDFNQTSLFANYKGLAKIVFTFNNKARESQVVYLPFFSTSSDEIDIQPGKVEAKYSIYGLVANDVAKIKIKSKSTDAISDVSVNNGLFKVPNNSNFSPEGVYQVDFYGNKNDLLRSRTFNKGDSKFGRHIMLDEKLLPDTNYPPCGVFQSGTGKTNLTIGTSCNNLTDQVLYFKNIPIDRAYDYSQNFPIDGLVQRTKYNIFMISNRHWRSNLTVQTQAF